QLVRTHPTPSQLLGVLFPRILKREWDVVAQLAFQIQNKNVEGAGDDLLMSLAEQVKGKQGGETWSILSFAIRCLEFIVPSPRVCRELTLLTLEMVSRDHSTTDSFKRGEPDPREVIAALVTAARENQRTIRETFEKTLRDRINSTDPTTASLAAEVALHL